MHINHIHLCLFAKSNKIKLFVVDFKCERKRIGMGYICVAFCFHTLCVVCISSYVIRWHDCHFTQSQQWMVKILATVFSLQTKISRDRSPREVFFFFLIWRRINCNKRSDMQFSNTWGRSGFSFIGFISSLWSMLTC